MKCPKCGKNMEEGYVNSGLTIWEGKMENHPDNQKNLTPNVAYVCKKCGYIELYRK